MSAFSVANQARYTRLFTRYGYNGTSAGLQISQTAGAVVDIVDQTRTGGITTSTNLVGMISRFEEETWEGQRVHPDDILLDIDSAIIPTLEDIITIEGRLYTIVTIRNIQTNDVVMGYVLHLRK